MQKSNIEMKFITVFTTYTCQSFIRLCFILVKYYVLMNINMLSPTLYVHQKIFLSLAKPAMQNFVLLGQAIKEMQCYCSGSRLHFYSIRFFMGVTEKQT